MSNNNKKNPKKRNYYYDDDDDDKIDIWDTYFTKSKKAGNSVMARLADPLLYHWEQQQRYEYHIQRKQQAEGTNQSRQRKAKKYSLTKDRIKLLDSIGFLWGSGPKDNKSSTTTMTTKKKQPTNNNKKESSTGNKAKNNKTGSTTTTNHEKGTKQLLTTTSKPPKTNNNKTNNSSANTSARPVSSNNNKSKEVAAVKKKKSTTNTNKKSSSALPAASRSKKSSSTSTTYVKNKSFQDRIKALKAFKKKHGHLNINRSLADKSLYDWSRDQRCFYRIMLRDNKKTVRSLTQERMRELNQIGFFEGVTCDKHSK